MNAQKQQHQSENSFVESSRQVIMIEANRKFYSYSIKFHTTASRRSIVLEHIEQTIQAPDERRESEHDPRNRFLYRKFIGDRWITVVVDEQEEMLITVWANEN